MPKAHVIVVGAGVSGLTTAWWLSNNGVSVTLLEQSTAPGGTMQTIVDEGWMVETGPNSTLETTPLFTRLFDELGISGERMYPGPMANNRFILRDGRLHPLPMSPLKFITSSLWSTRGKLRLLGEPFIGRGTREESIAEFVERRLGREFLDYAINPFVAGVYAGNPRDLSVRAAFPKLYALEATYGGLIKGMIKGWSARRKRKETAKDRAKMFSFTSGMGTLPLALARRLGDAFVPGVTVEGISRTGGGQYTLRTRMADGIKIQEADCVVLAVPSYVAGDVIQGISAGLSQTLRGIYYPPVTGVFLGFARSQLTTPLDGFGFLVPEKEERKILGTVWSSSLFPGRAPEGHVALTSFVGGSRNPDLASKTDKELVNIVTMELNGILGIQGLPVYSRVIRWQKAIPQYNLGYHAVEEAITQCEDANPGLFLTGNYRGGIAVGDCVSSSERLVSRVVQFLSTRHDDARAVKDQSQYS